MTPPARRNKSGQVKFSFDDVSPPLYGELTRAILTGGRYPDTLLANLVMRIRIDKYINRLRVSMIKAAIVRVMRLTATLPYEDYLVRRSKRSKPRAPAGTTFCTTGACTACSPR